MRDRTALFFYCEGMVMTVRYMSPTNTFLPAPTGQVIHYVRNPADFKLNRYCQMINSPDAPVGYYWRLDRDNPVRVISDAEFRWPPGKPAPTGHHNISNFEMDTFRCERYAFPWTLDEETVRIANANKAPDPITIESKNKASQAMTARTQNVIGVLETTGNWPTGHTDTATNVGGGKWDVGTSTAPYFKKSVLEAARRIIQATNGVAKLTDMRLVMSPTDAIDISASAEIHDYVKSAGGTNGAWDMITGKIIENPNEAYGLPKHFHNIELVIEDGMQVTSRPYSGDSTAATRSNLKATSSATLVYRPGGMDGGLGTQSFSTVQIFYHKYEMAVEMHHDTWNKIYDGRVVDWYTVELAAPHTGFHFTSITN